MKISEAELAQYDFLKDVPALSREVLGNSVYSYLLTAVTFVVIWMAFHILRGLATRSLDRKADQTAQPAYGSLSDLLDTVKPGLFPLLAFYAATQRLTLPAGAEKAIHFIAMSALAVQVAQIFNGFAAYLITRTRASNGGADDLVIKSANQNLIVLSRVGIWTGVTVFLLDNLGFNVSTFVAGLGIGGVAIALATQAILGDTFSSFAIALDKPFEVGDVIVVDDLTGNVEHIGLKTTRVRSSGGELLIFANSDLTKSRIKNFKKMIQRRASFKIGLAYGTTPDQLGKALEMLKGAVQKQPQTRLERAHFVGFGDTALLFEVVYFVLNPEYNAYMDIQQAINFDIIKTFEAHGIHMAYPTPSPAVAKSDKLR